MCAIQTVSFLRILLFGVCAGGAGRNAKIFARFSKAAAVRATGPEEEGRVETDNTFYPRFLSVSPLDKEGEGEFSLSHARARPFPKT